jgi:hypothetical protein
MIDYHKNLVSALKTVLPTHYEMTLTPGTKTPCISYMEVSNYDIAHSEVMGYSSLTYQVKVWANDIAQIQSYALQVDNVLRPLGFTRISSGELYDRQSTMIQKVMTYEALVLEEF